MRWITLSLLLCFFGLQYRLWIGPGSWEEIVALQRDIEQQSETNQRLTQRNHILEMEVRDLKQGLDSVEERARRDLGLIREGETYFLFVGKRQ